MRHGVPDMRSARARFFARDGKGFGFSAPAAGCTTDFHDPWRMVVGDGRAHRLKSIMPACNMHGPQPCRPELHRCTLSISPPMVPRLTPVELDSIFDLDRAGHRPIEIHAALTRKRTRHGIATPTLARLRAALRSATHRRPRRETRGRKRHAILQMGEKRKQQIKPAGGRAGRRRRRWGPRGR